MSEQAHRLPVVLLWHMHQPHYRDALTGEYVLPWTYLHAIKDYTDMAAHLEADARARAVVNFTPVLLEQLEEIAARTAEHLQRGTRLPDPVLALLGPEPVPLDPQLRAEAIGACLRAQRTQMIERFAPYDELAKLARDLATPERSVYASDQLVQDLAVWYHLAWLGETVRRGSTLAARLTERARHFTAADRRALLQLIADQVASVVPRFRALADAGRCELSMTPYGHPIVPLLFDFAAAREAVPGMPLPESPFYPGGAVRARWHIEEGLRIFARAFGRKPVGCWPSEGAVSEPTLRLLDECGFRWAASSSNVLRASLERSRPKVPPGEPDLHRPWHLKDTRLACFFRDDALSDLIGFTYSRWHGDDAATNFVQQLAGIAERCAEAGQVVLVALDGENAWEHYPANGYYFLKALYRQVLEHPRLELTTLEACLDRGLAPARLEQLVAGSWVHGTLSTWMGDPAKNRGWDLLCEAKRAFDAACASRQDPAWREVVSRQLALCESSDWFWWFGDYNPPDAVAQFDRLYRRQLINLYRLLGLEPPAALAEVICAGGGEPEQGGVMRRAS